MRFMILCERHHKVSLNPNPKQNSNGFAMHEERDTLWSLSWSTMNLIMSEYWTCMIPGQRLLCKLVILGHSVHKKVKIALHFFRSCELLLRKRWWKQSDRNMLQPSFRILINHSMWYAVISSFSFKPFYFILSKLLFPDIRKRHCQPMEPLSFDPVEGNNLEIE